MKRLPRKLKKQLKSKYKHRYNLNWLKGTDLLNMYKWFYKNLLGYNMNVKLTKN